MKGNVATTLVKFAVLAGGAAIGAILANWYDKHLTERAQRRSDHDRSRYEQGLGPMPPRPPLADE